MLSDIQNAIMAMGYSWTAGKTSVSELAPMQKRKRLGLRKSDTERPDKAGAVLRLGHPSAFDWRNNSGNYMTPIKDQSGCGACVAFGTCATIEAADKIYQKNPSLSIDLSEADLFFRGGGNCANGWYFEPALNRSMDHGICTEACYPYPDGPMCPNCDNQPLRIAGYTKLSSNDAVKDWIANYGPVLGGMDVYEDFFYYLGGIYRYSYGGYIGGHAVCLIGYDDGQSCWLGKNSWSTMWGEDGWFKIGYNECGLLRSYPAYGIAMSSSPGPLPPVPPVINPDLKVTKDGKFFITLTSIKGGQATLILNDKDLLPLNKSAQNVPNYIGAFKAGDGLRFDLKTSSGVVHNVEIFPVGWRVWQLRLGFTSASSKDFVFTLQEK